MDSNDILGYAFRALGIVIVFIAMFIAWGMYGNLSSLILYMSPQQGSGSNAGLNSSIGELSGSINSLQYTLTNGSNMMIVIALLFLFSYIGFRFMGVGAGLLKKTKLVEPKEKSSKQN
ncbi:MAG: hypothetical protein M1504_02425 [Candidatus Marsarchaeota archaeon]|nr:hypothetical protein [Candidatus Marsarchaeota archaeon]